MELVYIERSALIHLAAVHRPSGQPFLPDLLRDVVARYSFIKFLTTEELLRQEIKFAIGKFGDNQIQEMTIY